MATKHLITLFDVRSALAAPAWSPNVWKIRFVLNYKNLPYRTEWVPYPDITDVLSAAGVPPTRTVAPLYTVPAIVDKVEGADPKAISDSPLIADYLESTYPENPIYPDGSRELQLQHIDAIMKHVRSNMAFMAMPHTPNILEGRDKEYFVNSRKRILGVGVEEMFPPEKADAMWANLYGGLDSLSEYIDGRPHGQEWMFGSTTPTYADFALCSLLIWFIKSGPEKGWERIKERNDGKWGHLYQSCQKYMQI